MSNTQHDEKRDKTFSNRESDREDEELTTEQSSSAHKLPATPASDDDSPLGDTDQHSDA